MLLYFHNKLTELHLTFYEFFELAHYAMFNRSVTLNSDFAEYILHGVLPKYVQDYLKTLQQGESDGSHQLHQVQSDGANQLDGEVRPTPYGETFGDSSGLLDWP